MNTKRNELKKEYKQTQTQMGIYRIRNLANGKVLIGTAMNLPGILNSNKFQLKMGSHPNKELQTEWNEFGSEQFAFEVLDVLPPRDETGYDYHADLASLEELWQEKMEPYGERGYNERRMEKKRN